MTWFVYAILSAFLGSLSAILEKRTLGSMHAIEFSTALSFLAALWSAPILFTSSWANVDLKVISVLFGLSIVAAFAFIGITRAVRHMEISTSSPLLLVGPFMTAIMAYLLLGEQLSLFQWGGIALLAIGIYTLETKHFWRFGEFLRNIFGDKYTRYIMLGLLLYAFTGVGDRVVIAHWHVPPTLYTALIQLFLAFQFIFITLYYRGGLSAPYKLMRTNWKSLVFIALLTTGYRLMQAEATALAAIGLVVAVKRSSSLFTTIIGGELFHDKDIFRKSIACLIMICGVYLIALYG